MTHFLRGIGRLARDCKGERSDLRSNGVYGTLKSP